MTTTRNFYVGGYGKGVYGVTLDRVTGELTSQALLAEVADASFIAPHPTLPVVYCVIERGQGEVVALRDSGEGSLAEFSRVSSGGAGACHLTVHPSGNALFVANYSAGTVSLIPLKAGGALSRDIFTDQHVGSGPNGKRQQHAFAHSIYPHPDGKHLLSCDLGCDAVFLYTIDFDSMTLLDKRSIVLAPGSGPRHLAISSDGRFAYVANELSNSVDVLAWDAGHAIFSFVQSLSTLPQDFAGVSFCAEIRLHPSGKYLYVSNRGHDSITTFRVDPVSGSISFLDTVSAGGNWPRGFDLDPSGNYLIVANERSDSLVSFRINAATGVPSPTGHSLGIEKPACVRFVLRQP